MSDELIFDSERQMKRADRRRWLIPLLALAAVLVLAVAVALILRGIKTVMQTGGEETPYPYGWRTEADGSILLQLPHEDLPDCLWVATEQDAESAVRVASTVNGEEDSAFTLTPVREGRCSLTLTLQTQDETPKPHYRHEFLLEVTSEAKGLQAKVLSSSGLPLQTDVHGGGWTENSYQAYYETNGDLTVRIGCGEQERDWSCEILSGADAVSFLGLSYEENEVCAYFRSGARSGSCEMSLGSKTAAATLRLQCEAEANGLLRIVGHSAEYGEKPPKAEYAEFAEESLSPASQPEQHWGDFAP